VKQRKILRESEPGQVPERGKIAINQQRKLLAFDSPKGTILWDILKWHKVEPLAKIIKIAGRYQATAWYWEF